MQLHSSYNTGFHIVMKSDMNRQTQTCFNIETDKARLNIINKVTGCNN